MDYPYIFANRRGVPMLESVSVSVTSTDIQFVFNSHPTFSLPYTGLILFRLSQTIPSTAADTLPIKFVSGTGPALSVTKGSTDLTKGDLAGATIYLGFYDRRDNRLQILTGIA